MYQAITKKQDFLSLRPGVGIESAITGQVVWKGGGKTERVADAKSYSVKFKDAESRAKRSAVALMKRYDGYYKRTGKRYEVEQREKREAKYKAKKAEERRVRQIKDTGPELLDILEDLVRDIRDFGLHENNEPITNRLARAEGIILKAKTVPEKKGN